MSEPIKKTGKSCWSWRYREAVNLPVYPVYTDTLNEFISMISDQFGVCGQRWDLTYIVRRAKLRRLKYYGPCFHTRIKIHFKSQEDHVMYKLVYNFHPSTGAINV